MRSEAALQLSSIIKKKVVQLSGGWAGLVTTSLCIHFCDGDDTAELVLHTINSVKQLSICGAVADMYDELTCRISDCSESTGRLVTGEKSETMAVPTDLPTTNKTPRINDKVQGNLLHDYEQRFANLQDHLQLIKLCSSVGITKTVANGQYFTMWN